MSLDPTFKISDLRCQMSTSSSQESADGGVSQEVGAVDSCFSGEADCSIIDLSLPKSRCSDLSDSVSDTPMEVYSDVEESFIVNLKNDLDATEHSRRQTSPAPTQYEIPISRAASTEHQPVIACFIFFLCSTFFLFRFDCFLIFCLTNIIYVIN